MDKFLCQDCMTVVESDSWDRYHCIDSCPSCNARMCGCSLCLDKIDKTRLVTGYVDYDGNVTHRLIII